MFTHDYFGEQFFGVRYFPARRFIAATAAIATYFHGFYFRPSHFSNVYFSNTRDYKLIPTSFVEWLPDPLPGLGVQARRVQRCVADLRKAQRCVGEPRKVQSCGSISDWYPSLIGGGRRIANGRLFNCTHCGQEITRRLNNEAALYNHSLGGEGAGPNLAPNVIRSNGVNYLGSGSTPFVHRHWKCLDRSRYYRQARGAPISWRAAPGSIVRTYDDYDSVRSWGDGGTYGPWSFAINGVPQYFEDYTGVNGVTYPAVLRLPGICDNYKPLRVAENNALQYVDCCATGTYTGRSWREWALELSPATRGTIHGYANNTELDAYLAALSGPLAPYPFSTDDDNGSYGAIEPIDSGGVLEVYFDDYFSDPWDGVFPNCVGGYALWQLDPQATFTEEEFYPHDRTDINAEGILAEAMQVFDQLPGAGFGYVDLRYYHQREQSTNVSGYVAPPTDPEDPFCCYHGHGNTTGSTLDYYDGGIFLSSFQATP